jgi:hypothetical protein
MALPGAAPATGAGLPPHARTAPVRSGTEVVRAIRQGGRA